MGPGAEGRFGSPERIAHCPTCGAPIQGGHCWTCGAPARATSSAGTAAADLDAPGEPGRGLLGVAAIVLGVLWLGGLGSTLAIALGIVGLVDARTPGRRGRRAALAGLTIGVIGLTSTLGFVAVSVASSEVEPPPTTVEPPRPAPSTVPPTLIDPGPIGDARSLVCLSELRAIQTAATIHQLQDGSFPTTMADLVSGGTLGVTPQYYELAPESSPDALVIAVTSAGTTAGCPDP